MYNWPPGVLMDDLDSSIISLEQAYSALLSSLSRAREAITRATRNIRELELRFHATRAHGRIWRGERAPDAVTRPSRIETTNMATVLCALSDVVSFVTSKPMPLVSRFRDELLHLERYFSHAIDLDGTNFQAQSQLLSGLPDSVGGRVVSYLPVQQISIVGRTCKIFRIWSFLASKELSFFSLQNCGVSLDNCKLPARQH